MANKSDKKGSNFLLDDIDELYADSIAKLALLEYENSGLNSEMFNPKNANPIYSQELQYKKVNE